MQGNDEKCDKPMKVSISASAFEIDSRVGLSIEHELAINLGKLVLESDTVNTALLALGHQLRNLSKSDLEK